MTDPTFDTLEALDAWERKTSVAALRDIWTIGLPELKAINAQIARVKLAHAYLIEVKSDA